MELSTLFENCSLKESKRKDNKSAVIQQVSDQNVPISYNIDNFVDKTPIEEISSSIEDLDAAIIKTKNYRTQFKSKDQELHWAMNMKKDIRQTSKTKIGCHQGIYQRSRKCKKKHSTKRKVKKSWWKNHTSKITGLLFKMYQQSTWKANNWNGEVIWRCKWY